MTPAAFHPCPVPLTTPPCSAFGDPDFKEPLHLVTATPDVIRERLLPGDEFVILASDGLVSRVFSNLHSMYTFTQPAAGRQLCRLAPDGLVSSHRCCGRWGCLLRR